MLLPSKHAHPDQTVLAAAVVLLRGLRKQRIVGFDDLLLMLRPSTGSGSEFLFTPAVSLLFVLGLVEYHGVVDSFEYTGT